MQGKEKRGKRKGRIEEKKKKKKERKWSQRIMYLKVSMSVTYGQSARDGHKVSRVAKPAETDHGNQIV